MAVDFFLKLANIDGESVDPNHTGQISILSFSWGASQVTSVSGTGGSGAGKANLADLSIMKNYDKASAPLFKSLLAGTHIATGSLFAAKAGGGGKPFLQIDFKEMFVTSIQVSGSSETPMESVSFSYNEIKTTYSTQSETGVITATGAVTFDVKKNQLS